ncbi:putative stress resistance protein [Pectobacterium atrosepticum SCRI1043]|uniref:Stress resistance protein n=1 Tax=Pectobacterium atrosepticum (strain SCRI 1043 / ATCC BAA-672) TaxID=218491 RepID=Q6CZ43_PECAS|nr:cell-envelope stress modulator CpxP [Pectobacterium atrosepticum]GKV87606.1 universal stress protein [Pectobacterium carotovorum subsp. carotovorum]AIA73071.1 periplasmic stress adaptor protein CpxP [Pectobacterium atrosepticum]AIK16094.1 putative stress resistance protein [Pectobacterium atrosepticum]ATY92734.1 stress adaptor protein CpxP [Pectobacterium atrosepticum]KFX13287.1 periplasmic stress adaptor protein CpxP [Pectobacterium atrosepticum]
MQQFATLSLASLLMLGTFTAFAAENGDAPASGWHIDDSATKGASGQQGMFDGVRLTEQQRQQMRDLMHQSRQDKPAFNTEDVKAMHKLVTAETFDEAAVRAQITRMMSVQIERQIQMTRVRNQMYNLLTPAQKEILELKHKQRMKEMQQQISMFNQMVAPSSGTTNHTETDSPE